MNLHHDQLHASDHLSAGSDPLSLTDAEIPNTITLNNLTQITTRLHSSLQSIGVSDHHTKYTDAEAISAIQGEATLDLTGDVTIAVGKALAIGDSIQANRKLQIKLEATDLYGIFIDGETNDYSGESDNIGMYVGKHILAGTTNQSIASRLLHFALFNYRDFDNAVTENMESTALRGEVSDQGDWAGTSTGAARNLRGFWADTQHISGEDRSSGNNTLIIRGVDTYAAAMSLVVNKSAGTLTVDIYGTYSRGKSSTTLTAGTLVVNTYGGYFEGDGDTDGTQTVYGVYAKASGGDTNWAIYATDAPSIFLDKVVFTQTDGNEYIDSLADGYLDLEATTGIRFRIGGTEQVNLIDGVLQPTTNNDIDLGTDALEFKDIWIEGTGYFDAIEMHGDLDVDTQRIHFTYGSFGTYLKPTGNSVISVRNYDDSGYADIWLRNFVSSGVAAFNVMQPTSKSIDMTLKAGDASTGFFEVARLNSEAAYNMEISKAGDITFIDGKVVMFD